MATNEIRAALVYEDRGFTSGVQGAGQKLQELEGKTGSAGSKLDEFSGKVQGGATKALEDIQGHLGSAGGTLSQFGLNFGDVMGSGGAVALGVAGAGAVIGKFALDSVQHFTETGEAVKKFDTIAGTAAQDGSKWIEVSQQFGVSADSLDGSMGKLAKNLGNNQDALDKYGVSVAHNKDGTIDLAGTVENIATVYANTEDETQKAALAQAAFGKSWQNLIPLLEQGGDNIKQAFDNVPKGDILSQGDVDSAHNFAVTTEQLKLAIQGLENNLAKDFLPLLQDVAGTLGNTAKQANDGLPSWLNLGKAIDYVVAPLVGVKVASIEASKASDLVKDAWHGVTDGAKSYAEVVAPTTTLITASSQGMAQAAIHVDDLAAAYKLATPPAQELRDAMTEATAAADTESKSNAELTKTFDAAAKAQDALVTGMRDAADANENLADKTDGYTTFLAGLQKQLQAAHGDQTKLNAVYREGIDQAKGLADAQVNLQVQQDAANGKTTTATQKLETWNGKMVESASKLKGPMLDAIVAYIGQVNQIPAEKVSQIEAEIAQGKLDQAKADLDAASAARKSTITADADTKQAEADLDWAARTRHAQVILGSTEDPETARALAGRMYGGKMDAPAATGGHRVGRFLVGEQGAEIVHIGDGGGAYVYTNEETRAMERSGKISGDGRAVVINITGGVVSNLEDLARRLSDEFRWHLVSR